MKKGIAIAGNMLIDHNKEVDTYPKESTLASILRSYNTPGGAVMNSGIDLARLDPELRIHAVGVIGNDDDGRNVLDTLKKYPNINTDLVYTGKLSTSYTDAIFSKDKNTRTFLSYRGSNSELSPEHFDFSILKDCEILHIGYILLLDTMDEEDPKYGTKMAKVLAEARSYGIKTSIDVVTEDSDRFRRLVPPAIKYTDYCIINEEEASKTVGIRVRDTSGTLDTAACRKVCEHLFKMGVKERVIIHSREGGIGLDKDGDFVCSPSLKIDTSEIKGTTGAGDAFLAGSLYGTYMGYSLSESIKLGVAVSNSAIMVSGPTDGVKCLAETRAFYKSREKELWAGFARD